jgi:hypothetical protein
MLADVLGSMEFAGQAVRTGESALTVVVVVEGPQFGKCFNYHSACSSVRYFWGVELEKRSCNGQG